MGKQIHTFWISNSSLQMAIIQIIILHRYVNSVHSYRPSVRFRKSKREGSYDVY